MVAYFSTRASVIDSKPRTLYASQMKPDALINMERIKRRQMIKMLGATSLGIASSSFFKLDASSQKNFNKEETYCDILVVGGGTSGVIAAIQSARLGQKTILMESGSQLGGTLTTGGVSFPGIFHAWGKQIISGIGWELVRECVALNGDVLPDFSVVPDNKTIRHWRHQIPLNSALYVLLAEEKCIDAGVNVRYYESPVSVAFTKNRWTVISSGKGTNTIINCSQIIDCTGNASVVAMAGHTVVRDTEVQPGSLIFTLDGYDFENLNLSEIPEKFHGLLRQNMFINSEKNNAPNNFPLTVPYNYVYVSGADSTNSETHTNANIQGRKELLKLLREIKTYPGCQNIRISGLKTETAIRETYRISGLYEVTRDDYINGVSFNDAISYSFYPIDLHRNGKTIHQEYLKEGVVAQIPLRSLIPQNSNNLIVAGRCLSSDRMANSALRVQASCMGMGQAAAVTVSIANRMGVSPKDVPVAEVKKELIKNGAIVPQ